MRQSVRHGVSVLLACVHAIVICAAVMHRLKLSHRFWQCADVQCVYTYADKRLVPSLTLIFHVFSIVVVWLFIYTYIYSLNELCVWFWLRTECLGLCGYAVLFGICSVRLNIEGERSRCHTPNFEYISWEYLYRVSFVSLTRGSFQLRKSVSATRALDIYIYIYIRLCCTVCIHIALKLTEILFSSLSQTHFKRSVCFLFVSRFVMFLSYK